MTTKEFIRELEELGYEVASLNDVLIVSVLSEVVVIVDKRNTHTINTSYTTFAILNEENKERLMYLVLEYSSTPIADRVEEEKFYWRLKGSESQTDYTKYLWVTDIRNYWDFDQRDEATKYTQKEYDEFVKNGLIADIFEKEAIVN